MPERVKDMVNFFTGKADVDVTGKVRGAIADLLKKDVSGQKIIFIVPEQFEYETERAVYRLLKDKGLLVKMSRVDITTFTALASDILSENGEDRPRADDIVKNVLMHKAVAVCRGDLTSFLGVIDKAGFCEKMVATVTSFRSFGSSARDVALSVGEMEKTGIAKNDPMLFEKLKNVSILYTAFDKLMRDKGYLDSMDVIEKAAELVRVSDKFKGADVFIDSFNDFTNSQLRFLREIIPQANSMTFGFVTDHNNDSEESVSDRKDDCEVFKTANSHITRLISNAKAEDIPYNVIYGGIEPRYADNSVLGQLPRLLFQNKTSSDEIKDACEIVSAHDIFEELDFVCAKIKELADGGLRYRDIAVLCTDISSNQRYIESAFGKYEIPVFLDMHESILSQPLINAVMSLLNAARDFSVDTVMSCVKTRFFNKPNKEGNDRVRLTDGDINAFENYIYEWDLSAEHLKKPFTFKNTHSETDSDMEIAESVRRDVAEPLWKFSNELRATKKINGAKLTEKLYNYLIKEIDIHKSLSRNCYEPNSEERDGDRVDLYQRLWDTLMHIFDALHDEFIDVEITLDEYCRLFHDICASTTLADPPQMADRVLVGDIDRTRADNIKAAFIVGASYDLFPTPAPQLGIFSEYETELLSQCVNHFDERNGKELCLRSSKEQYSLSLYRAYKAICLPTEYLCLSYSELTQEGENMQISEVCDEIRGIFRDIKVKRASDLGDEFYCRSIRSAKLRYAVSESKAEGSYALGKALRDCGCGEFVEKIAELKNERSDKEKAVKHSIKPDTAKLLFPITIGATSVEKMSACKFSFFCEKGLNIKQRIQRNFNNSKRGEALHAAMEKILGDYRADIKGFCGLDRRGLYALSRNALNEYCLSETNGSFYNDPRTQFLFRNIANSAADVLITMQTEFSARRYRPKFFELDLSRRESLILRNYSDTVSGGLPEAMLFLDDESAADAAPTAGSCPVLSEHRIFTAPLSIPLNDGKTFLTVTGKIDRVDMFTDTAANATYVRAVDYKSSVHTFDIENAKHGVNIQMLLYLSALLEANSSNSSLKLTAGGISYIPSDSSGAQKDIVMPYRLLAINHRPSGLVVVNDVTADEYAKYESSIIERITDEEKMTDIMTANVTTLTDDEKKTRAEYEAGLEKVKKLYDLKEGNDLDETKFSEFLKEVKKNIGDNYSKLMNGDVCAVPLEYTETSPGIEKSTDRTKKPCLFCRFKDICKNDGSAVNDIKKEKKRAAKSSGDKKTAGKKTDGGKSAGKTAGGTK